MSRITSHLPENSEHIGTAVKTLSALWNCEQKVKISFFDLDTKTGRKRIADYFQPRLFGGTIDCYHILLTVHNPPLDNDTPEYNSIRLFLDYLDKNQLGWKVPYTQFVEEMDNLLPTLNRNASKTYNETKNYLYNAVLTAFFKKDEIISDDEKEAAEKIIKYFGEEDNPCKIFFRANQAEIKIGDPKDNHAMLRELEKSLIDNFSEFFEISKMENGKFSSNKGNPLDVIYKNRFVTLCRDIGASLVNDVFNWKSKEKSYFNVFIIDDNYKGFQEQLKVIKCYTPLRFYQLNDNNAWKKFYRSLQGYNTARSKDTADLFALIARDKFDEASKVIYASEILNFNIVIGEINETVIKPMEDVSQFDVSNSSLLLQKFDFILVDLQFGKHKIGDRIIRYLKRLLDDHDHRCPIFIFSLSEDSMDIQRCLNEGANGYIYKNRVFSIPYRLKEVYSEKKVSPSAAYSQNFRTLYNLPQPIIDRLKHKRLTGGEADSEWIDKLPKAELHAHLGGSMPADLIADLAFNHLRSLVYQKEANLDRIKWAVDRIKCKLYPIHLNKLHIIDKNILERIEIVLQEIRNDEGKKSMPFPSSEIREIAGETNPLEKFILTYINIDGLQENDILCILLVWLAYQSGYDPSLRWRKEEGFYFKLLKEQGTKHFKDKNNIYQFKKRKDDIKNLARTIGNSFEKHLDDKYDAEKIDTIRNLFPCHKGSNEVHPIYDSDACLLIKEILEAKNKDSSLIGYLRGCEISGAELQRSFENIIIAAFRIGLESSFNRIRYMELRCSPDGFVLPFIKEELKNSSLKYFISEKLDNLIFGQNEPEDEKDEKFKRTRYYQVLDALLWAYGEEFQKNSIQKANKDFIPPRITILISAKRHKDLGIIKNQTQMYQLYKNRFSHRIEYARILGFDLAGAEEGYPPTVFADIMGPLFQECSNMTVHAGEETDAPYIWQAIYKLHAMRIGHGLTLGQDHDLLQLAQERKICIEMCPTSNILTNSVFIDPENDKDKDPAGKTDKDIFEKRFEKLKKDDYKVLRADFFPENERKRLYPLKLYYDLGVPVAICRDNPCVSNVSMTEEYLKACKLSGGFSKWDILRIIKMGFKNAFLPKAEVARMLERIGNEVYDRILELEKIEKKI